MKIIRKKYYWLCPYCGAALDPEEPCDCMTVAGNKKEIRSFLYNVNEPGS